MILGFRKLGVTILSIDIEFMVGDDVVVRVKLTLLESYHYIPIFYSHQ
jgi:hypothetical protein